MKKTRKIRMKLPKKLRKRKHMEQKKEGVISDSEEFLKRLQ